MSGDTAPSLELAVEGWAPTVAVVRVTGRLDLTTAADLRRCLAQEVEGGRRRLVVDLAGVPFLDSSGLGALVLGLKRVRAARGDLRLAGVQAQVSGILQLTSLDRVLPAYASVEDALADP